MRDNLEKFFIYFKKKADYWYLNDTITSNIDNSNFHYPLSFRDRLYQEHYTHFDNLGIPMFHSKSGELVHFCTGMCSYAFAHWEEYLKNSKSEHAEQVVKIADYLIKMAEDSNNNGLMIYDYGSDSDFGNGSGTSCAMNQGEAISVMCRAYSFTKDDSYLMTAKRLAIPFNSKYGKDGVHSWLESIQDNWYLEGGEIILNGHIYALFGLFELFNLTKGESIERLFNDGERALEKALSLFDKGNWSWYWLNEPKYIASAMYHNLHIVQLQAMHLITGKEIYKIYSNRFEKYSNSQMNRLNAGFLLFKSKIKAKF